MLSGAMCQTLGQRADMPTLINSETLAGSSFHLCLIPKPPCNLTTTKHCDLKEIKHNLVLLEMMTPIPRKKPDRRIVQIHTGPSAARP